MGDGGDEEMVDFLQRLIGYTLCGDAVERIMVEMYGPTGSNGKKMCIRDRPYTIDATFANRILDLQRRVVPPTWTRPVVQQRTVKVHSIPQPHVTITDSP